MINDEERFAQLGGGATLGKLIGTKVVTESSQPLQTISQLEIDHDARSVTSHVLSASLVDRVMSHEEEEAVQAREVVRLGQGGVVVVADAVGDAAPSPAWLTKLSAHIPATCPPRTSAQLTGWLEANRQWPGPPWTTVAGAPLS
jgi:sporulation protein YlmC with PRC-barrel domain